MSESRNNPAPQPEENTQPVPEGGAFPAPAQGKKKSDLATDLFTWLQALTLALVLLVAAFAFFGRIIGVDGSSMVPTLKDGDLLLLQCVAYEPERGDVVVLRKPFAEIDSPIVKRVIAVGGQSVDIDYNSGTVYVDGEALDEPYINERMYLPSSERERGTHWDVPEGSVFVMGDNRNASSDSRHVELGTVDTRYILGRAVCVLLPPGDIGAVE